MATTESGIEIRRLEPEGIALLREIDRSEHVTVNYSVAAGELVSRPELVDVPPWDPDGSSDHSVTRLVDQFLPVVNGGALLLAAYHNRELAGLAIVDPGFAPGMAWLALLHVSRAFRRIGAASALWTVSAELAREAGAKSMYVSATPTGSAVGFYLSRGCRLAQPPDPDLLRQEPEDIHFVCQVDAYPLL
jgi:GNAT superfamily N-acetyltransferase